MNKYQDALNEIHSLALPSSEDAYEHRSMYLQERYDLLQELIDKATPKKPMLNHIATKFDKLIGQQTTYICPECRNACLVKCAPNGRNQNNYCYDCGQALDWSDE